MTRPGPLVLVACTLLALAATASPALASDPNQPPQPSVTGAHLVAPTAAGWSCANGKCSYAKASGTWADCFVSWSPTHAGWLPTRYCR